MSRTAPRVASPTCLAVTVMSPPSGVNLKRVGQQVVQHLLHADPVRQQAAEGRGHLQDERDASVLRLRAKQRKRLLQERGHVARLRVDLHPTGLDAAEIEEIVDEPEQLPAGRGDMSEMPPLLRAEWLALGHEQQVGEPDDGVQRLAQVMGHARQKLGLGL